MEKKANWHKAKHGLITKAKISFGLQNKKVRAQTERRRGEEKEKKKKKKRREERRRKRSSRKIQRYGI